MDACFTSLTRFLWVEQALVFFYKTTFFAASHLNVWFWKFLVWIYCSENWFNIVFPQNIPHKTKSSSTSMHCGVSSILSFSQWKNQREKEIHLNDNHTYSQFHISNNNTIKHIRIVHIYHNLNTNDTKHGLN